MIHLAEPTTTHQGLDLFLPSWDDLLWSVVVIAIIAVAFYKWILPPMLKILDERKEAITGGMEQAAYAREAADNARAAQEKVLAKARADASKMRDQAREESKAILAEQRQAATAEATRITDAAARQIEAERKAAEVSLRSDVGTLAGNLAEKIVGQSLVDDTAKSKLIDQFLDQYEASLKPQGS